MIGAHQNLNNFHNLTTPLWGMFCHRQASTYYDQLINQIWRLYLAPPRRYERRYKMSKIGWFG